MPYAQWKSSHQSDSTPEQLDRMAISMARNPDAHGRLSEQG